MANYSVPTAADLNCHCPKHEPHSIIASPVAAVWQLVACQPTLRRCELQRIAEAAGINKWTARTQIQAALKERRLALATGGAELAEQEEMIAEAAVQAS